MNTMNLLDEYFELQNQISNTLYVITQRKYSENNCKEELLQLLLELKECYYNEKLQQDEICKRISSIKLKYEALKDFI